MSSAAGSSAAGVVSAEASVAMAHLGMVLGVKTRIDDAPVRESGRVAALLGFLSGLQGTSAGAVLNFGLDGADICRKYGRISASEEAGDEMRVGRFQPKELTRLEPQGDCVPDRRRTARDFVEQASSRGSETIPLAMLALARPNCPLSFKSNACVVQIRTHRPGLLA